MQKSKMQNPKSHGRLLMAKEVIIRSIKNWMDLRWMAHNSKFLTLDKDEYRIGDLVIKARKRPENNCSGSTEGFEDNKKTINLQVKENI